MDSQTMAAGGGDCHKGCLVGRSRVEDLSDPLQWEKRGGKAAAGGLLQSRRC